MDLLRAYIGQHRRVAALKAVPRAQREVEGRASRKARATLRPVFDKAVRSVNQGTWSPIKAYVMEMDVMLKRKDLIAAAREQADAAGQYGRNRIVRQAQRLGVSARHSSTGEETRKHVGSTEFP